ncbi:hypothetical protein Tco_0950737 [Tanacetum coccineum]
MDDRLFSLRYDTGEKKLNEVDFISHGVKLVSRIPTIMTKSGVEFNLRIDYRMVVKDIEGGLLEEIEVSHFGKEQDIDGEKEDDNEKKVVMINEEGWMS